MEMDVSQTLSVSEAGVAMPSLGDETLTTHTQGTMHLPRQVLAGFKRVEKAVGLKTDADVASFLIHLYDCVQSGSSSNVQCIRCQNFLSLVCKSCLLAQSVLSANNSKHFGHFPVEETNKAADPSEDEMVVSSDDIIEYMSDGENTASLFDMATSEVPAFPQDVNSAVCQADAFGSAALNETEDTDPETVSRECEGEHAAGCGDFAAESQLPVPGNCDYAGTKETLHSGGLQNQYASRQVEALGQHDISSRSEQELEAVELDKTTARAGRNKERISEAAAKRNASKLHSDFLVNNPAVTEEAAESLNPFSPTEPATRSRGGFCRAKRVNKASLRSERLLQRVNRAHKAQVDSPVATASTESLKPTSYPCKELGCSEEFSSQAELRNHIKIHNDVAPFRCPECGQRFTVKDKYNEHLRTHYRCDECGVSWIYKRSVERHRKSKHENGGSLLVCPDCGLTFHHKNAYYHHVRQNHVKEHKCEECDMTFSDYIELRRHLEEHYRCDECKVSFSCKSGYKGHMTVKHGAEATAAKPGSVCHICGKNTPNMREHMRFHTGVRPFQCDVCQKTFRTKTVMRRHKFIHTGQRPYQCHLCPANYKDPSGLRAHLLIHGGNRPFKCTNCPKSYTKAYELKLHMRYHTGETPYECPACHKKFRTAGEKEMHVRRKYKTGETPCMGPVYQPREFSERHRFECPVCGKKFLTSSHLKQHRNRRNKHGMPCFHDPA